MKNKRRNHSAQFKAKVALAAAKGLLLVSTVDSNCSSTLRCHCPVVDSYIINQA